MGINGQPITGDSNSVIVVYNGTNASPVGQIVLNEIMYAPTVSNAQFVELYNSSTNTTFDLSGWQFQGLGYTFPNGSTLAPTNYLVLAANGAAFRSLVRVGHGEIAMDDGERRVKHGGFFQSLTASSGCQSNDRLPR